jgi:hypothetical protein
LLDYTEFAARRFDFLGQKAIYAKYIADLHAQAQAQTSHPAVVRNILGRINGDNGLIQDMRDQTTLLRDMYRKLWLGDNLPYFLGNIAARYDEELGRWEEASSRVNRLKRVYDQHALPALIDPAEPAGK